MSIDGGNGSLLANTAAIVSSLLSPTQVTTIPQVAELKGARDEGRLEKRLTHFEKTLGGTSASVPPEINSWLGQQLPASPPDPLPIVVKPGFKFVFLCVFGLTVLCGFVQIWLAFAWPDPTTNQQSAFDSFGFAWKTGIGAIFGLLGGKVT